MQTAEDQMKDLTNRDPPSLQVSHDAMSQGVGGLSWSDHATTKIELSSVSLLAEKLLDAGKLASSLNVQQDKLREMRQDVLLQRDQAIYEWKSTHYKVSFLRESGDDLSKKLEAVAGGLSSSSHAEEVRRLQSRWREDCDAFETQIEKLRELETKLERDERRMQRKEALIDKTTKQLFGSFEKLGLPLSYDLGAPAGSSTTTTQSAKGPSDVRQDGAPPAIARFYGKIADLRIMYERVCELLEEFTEEKLKRDLQEARGLHLELSTIEFEQAFHKEHEQTLVEYRAARRAAHEARTVCEQEGLMSLVNETLLNDGIYNYGDRLAEPLYSLSGQLSERFLGALAPSDHGLDERHRVVSSSRLTILTEALNSSAQISRRARYDWQYSQEAVWQWLNGVDPSYTSDHDQDQSHLDIIDAYPHAIPLEAPEDFAVGPESDTKRSTLYEIPMPGTSRAPSSSESNPVDSRTPGRLDEAVSQIRSFAQTPPGLTETTPNG